MGRYAAIAAATLLLAGGGYLASRMLGSRPAQPTPTPDPVAQATPPPTTFAPVPEEPFEPVEGEDLFPEGEDLGAAGEQPGQVPLPDQPPVTEPPAMATPEATPPPTATPTPSATPPPTTQATPSPIDARAQRVARLLGQAQEAMRAGRYDDAAGLYDQVLGIDSGNAPATSGRAQALAAAEAAKKSFVSSRTAVRGGTGAGFSAGGVSVERDYSGRIQYEVSPSKVKPGDSYSVKIHLTNDGKKPFRIEGLSLSVTADGQEAPQPATPPGGELGPGNRVQLGEISGVWQPGVQKWFAEVTVNTDKKVTLRSRLTWR